MKRALLPMLLLLAHPAFADTLAIGPHVLVDGDPSDKARQLLGKPDKIVRNRNRFGVTFSETWEWDRDGKTLRIEMQGGKIEGIREAR